MERGTCLFIHFTYLDRNTISKRYMKLMTLSRNVTGSQELFGVYADDVFDVCFNICIIKWIRLKNRNCKRIKYRNMIRQKRLYASFLFQTSFRIYTCNSIKMIGYARVHQHKDFVISTNPRHFVEILKEMLE